MLPGFEGPVMLKSAANQESLVVPSPSLSSMSSAYMMRRREWVGGAVDVVGVVEVVIGGRGVVDGGEVLLD